MNDASGRRGLRLDGIFALLRDVRLAARSLCRTPDFTLIAIVTLGLGIGANTSMFGVLNEVLLRPLPYSDGERLDRIYRTTARDTRGGISAADFLDAKAGLKAYGEIAAYGDAAMSLSEPGHPAEIPAGLRVSWNLFAVLGARPQLGRTFQPDEDRIGNHRVLVISDRYWRNRFGGDPRVVGRAVRVDGEVHEIVGVLPATFNDWRHLGWVDLFRPLGLDAREAADRGSTWLRLVGRRSSPLTRAQAEGVIAGFGRHLAKEFPAANTESGWRTIPIDKAVMDEDGPVSLGMLIGLSGFVLRIACSNLANLLLARTMARARELAVRSALGASRARLLRPLVTESMLLALSGGAFAIFVARWVADWLAVRSTGDNGESVLVALDWRVLGWALAASLVTVVAFGLAPALFAMRLDLNGTLKSGARGTTEGRGHQSFRKALVVGQFALAMILLSGGALFARGLRDLNTRRHGWESDRLVAGSMLLPAAKYPGAGEITAFQRLTLDRLAALPGVESVSLSYRLPFFGLADPRRYVVAGLPRPEPGHEPAALINGVTPRYFETVGTRLLRGRAFGDGDTLASPRVFVINQAMARGLFGDDDPIGRRLGRVDGGAPEWGEIVGVVADVQSVYPDRAAATYQLYQPMAQEPRHFAEIGVRAAGATPSSLVEGIRTAMTALDPDLPVRKLQPADARIARANYQLGVLSSMLSAFAVLGLGLASLGVYGVIARTMAQRTGEFGIRMALGAQVRDITRLVLGSGARLAFVGSGLGLLGAVGISRLIAAGFPGMRIDTVPVVLGASLVLVAIALLACYLPARRAARISPTEMLRVE